MKNSHSIEEPVNNTQKNSFIILFETEELNLRIAENLSTDATSIPDTVNRNIIHFYFCLEGSAIFAFGPHYSRQIEKQHNYFFYNPDTDLPLELKLSPNTRFVSLSIS